MKEVHAYILMPGKALFTLMDELSKQSVKASIKIYRQKKKDLFGWFDLRSSK